jgi:hypothetical protein
VANHWPDTYSRRVKNAHAGFGLSPLARQITASFVDAVKEHTPVDEGRITEAQHEKWGPKGLPDKLEVREGLRHRPGALRDSIHGKRIIRKDLADHIIHHGGVESNLDWASFVEDDTAPHLIASTKLQSYFDERAGEWVFTRTSRHPGTEGAHMFAKASAEMDAFLELRGQQFLERWKRDYF